MSVGSMSGRRASSGGNHETSDRLMASGKDPTSETTVTTSATIAPATIGKSLWKQIAAV